MNTPDSSSDRSSSARRDAAAFLPLVGHVVNQLATRYPRRFDRQELWTAGAWGLVAAVGHAPQVAGAAFTSYVLRTIRAHVLDAYRGDARAGDDARLAAALDLSIDQLVALRASFVPVQRPNAVGQIAGAGASSGQRSAGHSVYAAAAAVF